MEASLGSSGQTLLRNHQKVPQLTGSSAGLSPPEPAPAHHLVTYLPLLVVGAEGSQQDS